MKPQEIKNIEKIIGIELKQVEEIKWDTRGYQLNEAGEVVGLGLYDANIEDCSFLNQLKNLSKLGLSDNKISDIEPLIEPLKELKNLSELDLSSNKISNIEPLRELKNLSKLNLAGNQISNIAPLKELKNLSELVLWNNQISDISFLKELKNLSSLDLSGNQISDIEPLKELKNLSKLDLGGNQISNIEPLIELKNLSKLDLGGNQISNIELLIELKNLSKLDLSNNKISNIEPLKELKNLSELNLFSNKIRDIEPLKELKNLSELNLWNNQIIDIEPLKELLKQLKKLSQFSFGKNKISNIEPLIEPLKELKNLSILDLKDNKISNIEPLKELKNLSELDLSRNQIRDIEPIIEPLKELKNLSELSLEGNQISNIELLIELKNLSELNLGSNEISNIEPLKELKNLSELNLGSNEISNIEPLKELHNLSTLYLNENEISNIEPLIELKNLSVLWLMNNQISNIEPLKELKKLLELLLWSNQISNIEPLKELKKLSILFLADNEISNIEPLKELKNLSNLSLGGNKISNIEPLKELKNLSTLDLSANKIRNIEPLKELKNLSRLDLSRNQIKSLPEWITAVDMDITMKKFGSGLNLYANPIETPPIEIVEQGKQAINDWFEQSEKYGTEKVYEGKVLIVGEPGAGKTTLLRKLFHPATPVPAPEGTQKSTLGIEVKNNRMFRHPKLPEIEMAAHIWDFGGQEIQYSLHHFFITDNSVYILISDGRTGRTRYDYWFQLISILGKNSPVVVVVNKKENASVTPFDKSHYHKLFGNKIQFCDLEVDFKHNNHEWDNLLNTIAAKLSGLPIMGQENPKPWKKLRTELNKLCERKYISLERFLEMSNDAGIESEKDAMSMLRYFHCIGVALHFRGDLSLANTVFLDPDWIGQAVYAALSSDVIERQSGTFEKEKLFAFWQKKGYKESECNHLLNLMLKDNFDVCYQTDDKRFVVPLKLSSKTPDYDWNSKDNLSFRFQYPFMPAGLLSRLIVRMNEDIHENCVWLKGVVLKKKNIRAEIKQDYSPETGVKFIGIRVSGNSLQERKDFLKIIRHEIEKIHTTTFPEINVSEMVVCNCEVCANSENPKYYDYEELQIYLEEGDAEIRCTKSRKKVPIYKMISETFTDDELRKSQGEFRKYPHKRREDNKRIEKLDGAQRKALKLAINAAFHNFDDFEMFLSEEMDIELNGIVSDSSNMPKVAFDTIKWAIKNGKIHELIVKLNENSDNPKIKAFYSKTYHY